MNFLSNRIKNIQKNFYAGVWNPESSNKFDLSKIKAQENDRDVFEVSKDDDAMTLADYFDNVFTGGQKTKSQL